MHQRYGCVMHVMIVPLDVRVYFSCHWMGTVAHGNACHLMFTETVVRLFMFA